MASRPQALSVSPDGRTLAVSDNAANVRYYDLPTRTLRATTRSFGFSSPVATRRDGSRLVEVAGNHVRRSRMRARSNRSVGSTTTRSTRRAQPARRPRSTATGGSISQKPHNSRTARTARRSSTSGISGRTGACRPAYRSVATERFYLQPVSREAVGRDRGHCGIDRRCGQFAPPEARAAPVVDRQEWGARSAVTATRLLSRPIPAQSGSST